MTDNHDKSAFQMDPQAKSFRMTGFRWRDTPFLLFGLFVTMALLTGINFVADRSLSFLDRDSKLLVCGTLMGFGMGVWVGNFLSTIRRTSETASSKPVRSPDALG